MDSWRRETGMPAENLGCEAGFVSTDTFGSSPSYSRFPDISDPSTEFQMAEQATGIGQASTAPAPVHIGAPSLAELDLLRCDSVLFGIRRLMGAVVWLPRMSLFL